jgi:tRNA G18 (ribose-2'-O)-methylase SpoU
MAEHALIVVLDNIRSMHNVGSIFRTADAFGVEAVYLCGYTPKPPHRDIHKTALGATDSVKWKYFDAIADAIRELRQHQYYIVAIEQTRKGQPLRDLNPHKRVALIFGNEVNGVGTEALEASDAHVYIPQRGMKKSLNVSVCVGIVLWHCTRD